VSFSRRGIDRCGAERHYRLVIASARSMTAIVVLGLAPGCMFCDGDVCSDVLWVYAREPGGGALQDGEYVIAVETDGAADSGTCVVSQQGHAIDCDGLAAVIHAPIYDHPDNPHTVLELYYEAGDPGPEPPERIAVTITHDGVVVLDESFEPDYELAEPKKCDPDCVHAMHRFTLER
jgi:hypothetical protein